MFRTPATATRSGFTLVELLVVVGLIVVLATLALIVVPGIMEQDRTTDGAGLTRQWLMVAKGRAARDKQPRGVRLVTGFDPTKPAKTNQFWVTELQYIEVPAVIFNQTGVGDWATYPYWSASPTSPPQPPMVEFEYLLAPQGTPPGPPPPAGAITQRYCRIKNLPLAMAQQIEVNALISVPTLRTGHRVTIAPAMGTSILLQPPTAPAQPLPLYTVQFQNGDLDSWPDAELGAESKYVSYQFGILAAPQALIGEPTLQLPSNVCIDLTPTSGANLAVSRPAFPAGSASYDIVFLPNGQVMPIRIGALAGDGQIFLWVRDYTKTPNPLVATAMPVAAPWTFDLTPFQKGGEQQIVAIKTRSGSMGVFPVTWPQANGQYPAGSDPYTFARQGATGP